MIAALFMLAQLTPAPEQPKPIETTIAAIRANPKKFDGQVVRVHGYVNRCAALDCDLSERLTNSPAGSGEALTIAVDRKFYSMITPLMPTYVEFDAQFDAACLLNICTDGPAELTIVRLRSVVSPEPPPFEN